MHLPAPDLWSKLLGLNAYLWFPKIMSIATLSRFNFLQTKYMPISISIKNTLNFIGTHLSSLWLLYLLHQYNWRLIFTGGNICELAAAVIALLTLASLASIAFVFKRLDNMSILDVGKAIVSTNKPDPKPYEYHDEYNKLNQLALNFSACILANFGKNALISRTTPLGYLSTAISTIPVILSAIDVSIASKKSIKKSIIIIL